MRGSGGQAGDVGLLVADEPDPVAGGGQDGDTIPVAAGVTIVGNANPTNTCTALEDAF